MKGFAGIVKIMWMVFFGAVIVTFAETPYEVAWKRQPGTSNEDWNRSVAVDAMSNVYISGRTYGNLGGTNAGGADAVVTKYDGAGNCFWSRQIGTNQEDQSFGVTVDTFGNVYICGYTYGSLEGVNAGSFDAFVTKYDGAGNLLWTRQIGTAAGDCAYSVVADSLGNVYVSGGTSGSLCGTNTGSWDAFLIKYDASGTLLWSQQLGTTSSERSTDMAVDAIGNVFICGGTSGSLGGNNRGLNDVFVAKYHSSGNRLWVRQIGTPAEDCSYFPSCSMAVDSFGNVFISGETFGSLGGPNEGDADVFLVKYDGAGNYLWSRQFGTNFSDFCFGVAVDSSGNAFISGNSEGSLGGPNEGNKDAVVTKYDGSGTRLWSRQIGTSSWDSGYSVAVDPMGHVYISGNTSGSLGGASQGGGDVFIIKLQSPLPDVFYSNTFESTVGSEWSSTVTKQAPYGQKFLGDWTNSTISLSLNELPDHSKITLEFDLYIIYSMDGNYGDLWTLSVQDGPVLLHTTFSNPLRPGITPQSYPGNYPSEYPAQTGAYAVNSLGFNSVSNGYINRVFGDSTYHLVYSFDHNSDNLVVNFQGNGMQSLLDESWGIDNVVVKIVTPDPIPGDANRDGMVDVGDLGIVAAHYGVEFHATWSMGDFNGDEDVDVGDLGILAAHYGEGVINATVNFNTDYARALGTTVTNQNDSAEDSADQISEISSWTCRSLGLVLVAGVALMGFMLVKLDE
jgi:hypothetical protein